MKKFTVAVSMMSLFAPVLALAHGDKLEMTTMSITEALKNFKVDHAADVAAFQGVKSWFEGDEVKVRIYLPNSVTVLYACMHMENANGGEETLQCHMQM